MLDGFVYRRLFNPGVMVRGRVRRLYHRLCGRAVENTRIDDWLRRQLPANQNPSYTQFRPQPYRQLAAVLRAQGLDRDAKTVLVEMARDRRKWGEEGSRLRQWLLWATIRNGYQPIRAGLLLIVLWIFGCVAFGLGYNARVMVPIYKDLNIAKELNPTVAAPSLAPANFESFCAAIYAIDTSLPIISLGQRERSHPAVPKELVGTPPPDAHGGVLCDARIIGRWFRHVMSRWFHQTEARATDVIASFLFWFRWGYIAVGWFLTAMFLAGISGLVGRE